MQKGLYMDNDICDKTTILPIGTKNGCFTVIAGFEAYQEERAKDKIAKLEEEKQKFINGEKSSWHNFDSAETFDKLIQQEKDTRLYKVQCKCGKTFFRDAEFIFRKRWRDCSEDCALIVQREVKAIASYKRIKSSNYDITFVNSIHDSLEIVECTNDNVEAVDKRNKKVYIYKEFRCKCYLCGREYTFQSDEFEIRSDRYGRHADIGYYCKACCECRDNSSSFQWRTVKILNEHRIPYKVEVSFPDLLSEKGNPLRFDFAILNESGDIKCLIECQGEQHYKIGGGYGGYANLNARQCVMNKSENTLKRIPFR